MNHPCPLCHQSPTRGELFHKYRIRFAWWPVDRVVLAGGYIKEKGRYWWRPVHELDAHGGRWVAYSHYNDDLLRGA